MKTALVIRHLAFEDLGNLEQSLKDRSYSVRYLEAPTESLAQMDDALAPDLVVSLGGPISVNDEALFSFITDEIAFLKKRLLADRPTLGICLGAQMMAKALGARIAPGPGKEIGWKPLALTRDGLASPLGELVAPGEPADAGAKVLHWHGEAFDLPAGAVRLASTDVCPNQAFVYGKNCLALQFHLEATGLGLERWYVGHIGELSAVPGLSLQTLRTEGLTGSARLEPVAKNIWARWLGSLA